MEPGEKSSGSFRSGPVIAPVETGLAETIARRVTYILPGGQFGVEPGFVVMGVQDVR